MTQEQKQKFDEWLTHNMCIDRPLAELIVKHVENYFSSDSPTQQEGEDVRTDIAQILKDNITFAPQVDGYIVHGAIDKIIEYFSQRK